MSLCEKQESVNTDDTEELCFTETVQNGGNMPWDVRLGWEIQHGKVRAMFSTYCRAELAYRLRFARLLLALVFVGFAALASDDVVVIEMEDFSEARSEHKDFAKTRRQGDASGQQILYRIFNDGTLHYSFSVPKDGDYSGWIRYTRKVEKQVRFTLDGGDFIGVKCAAIAQGEQKREEWGWLKLFEKPLSEGGHSIVLSNSPWKIDCIVLSAEADFTPSEVHSIHKATEEDLRVMGTAIVPIVPDYLKDLPEYRLPEWFDAHRVQLHTRLGMGHARKNEEVFYNAAKYFKEMGVTVFSRHIVTGGEGAWWPSSVGEIHELAGERNIAKEIIEDAHRHGTKIIVYNRHVEDDWAAEKHPDWRCVDWNGKPIMASRGVNMCMNSPYADYVLKRQLELVDLGADGFFYDHVHMPREGCWCQYCRKKFKAETGFEHPDKEDALDPLWHKLKEFNNNTIARTFVKWRRALHKRRADVVMVIGSNLWPCLSDKHMDHRAFRIMDSHKTEFNKGLVYRSPRALWPFPATMRPMDEDVRLGYGFDVSRDASDGRPAHIWAHRVKYESHALAATAGMVAHGCIANLDVRESEIPDMNFKTSFEMGDRVSPFLAGKMPLRWAAVLHSEYARDLQGLDAHKVWSSILYPMYGAYHVLLRDHVPVGFLTDSQLEQNRLEGIEVIFVPDHEHLTGRMKMALDKFEKRGGTVVKNRPGWEWHTESGWQDAVAGFREALSEAYKSVPVRASGGNEKMHLQAYWSPGMKSLTVCMANDFSWVEVGGKGEEGYVEGDTDDSVREKPAPCDDVVLTLDLGAGTSQPKVLDVLNNQELQPAVANESLTFQVPAFEYLAVISVEL